MSKYAQNTSFLLKKRRITPQRNLIGIILFSFSILFQLFRNIL